MYPFTYVRASTPEAAIGASLGGGAAYLAGGTTLLDLMKLDAMRADRVVDINSLAAQFGGISTDSGGLRLGALAKMSEAAEHAVIREDYPMIAQSLLLAASPQLRNMATLGGNVLQRTRCNYFRDPGWGGCGKRAPGTGCSALDGVNRKHAVLGTSEHCIATYAGDFAQALIALDATVEIVGPNGFRRMPFMLLHREPGETPHIETSLMAGDLIAGFSVPAAPWTRRSTYVKVRDRESYEFALASAAVALDLDGDRIRTARIGLGGVATRLWRAHAAEELLAGQVLTPDVAARAAAVAFRGANGRRGNAFKIELGQRTLVRGLMQAAALRV